MPGSPLPPRLLLQRAVAGIEKATTAQRLRRKGRPRRRKRCQTRSRKASSQILRLQFLRAIFTTSNPLADGCPSADDLRLIRRFEKGGSGSSGLEFKRLAADAASGGLRWLYA